MTEDLGHLSYKESLRQLRLFSLEGLINMYEYLVGGRKERTSIFSVLSSHRTRGNGHELKYRNLHLNIRRILV